MVTKKNITAMENSGRNTALSTQSFPFLWSMQASATNLVTDAIIVKGITSTSGLKSITVTTTGPITGATKLSISIYSQGIVTGGTKVLSNVVPLYTLPAAASKSTGVLPPQHECLPLSTILNVSSGSFNLVASLDAPSTTTDPVYILILTELLINMRKVAIPGTGKMKTDDQATGAHD